MHLVFIQQFGELLVNCVQIKQ